MSDTPSQLTVGSVTQLTGAPSPPLGGEGALWAAGEPARRIAELEAALQEAQRENERLRKALTLMEHKVITCGVAATHSDPNLTRTGAYASAWDSPQAESVRVLRHKLEGVQQENEQLRYTQRTFGTVQHELLCRAEAAEQKLRDGWARVTQTPLVDTLQRLKQAEELLRDVRNATDDYFAAAQPPQPEMQ